LQTLSEDRFKRGMNRNFLITVILLLGFLFSPELEAATRDTDLYWLPENVTQAGHTIDGIFYFIFWITTAVFILTQLAMVGFLIKFRRREGVKAKYLHGNNRLEIVWTLTPLLFFFALGLYGNRVWNEMRRTPPPAEALQLDIVAEQYGWHFRYAGADGILGKTDSKLMDGGNSFGLLPDDPAGKDDVMTYNEMVIPVDKAVQLHLRSRDVIHAFYVPQFRLYQDMVPGKEISWVWFQTDKTGSFQVACNQLCGSGHYKMFAKLSVVSPAEFGKFLLDRAPKPKTAEKKVAAGPMKPPSIGPMQGE
jgi:cytochrome c oxidase subunit 2